MTFDPERVETVTVDSYGTLVDTDTVQRALADVIEEPEPVSALWRSRSLTYTMISNHIGGYQPFYEMNRDGLAYALEAHGVDTTPEERDEILAAYHDLDPFADVRDGLRRLRDAGYPVYVVSNGNPEMLDSMVETADLGEVLEDTISVHERGVFKPDAEVYRHGAARTGTPIRKVAHAASPTFDVQGAIAAGMQGVWVDRGGAPWEQFGPEPDLVVGSFHDLADELGA